jgi:uncharacterized membrane protein YkoI
MVRLAMGIAAAVGLAAFARIAGAAEGDHSFECFTVAQTRQKIVQQGLADPVPLLRKAGSETQGQPLSAQLCRHGEILIYEIMVLRRDGRMERVVFNAANGKPHPLHGTH